MKAPPMRLPLVATTALAAITALAKPSMAIEGGHPAPQGSVVANRVVAVHNAVTEALCTGVVVTRTAVLTAAHCASSDQAVTVIFQTDTRRPIDAGSAIAASAFVAAPAWDERKNASVDRGDLALAILDHPIPQAYTPAVLVDADNRTLIGPSPERQTVRGILAGYGNESWFHRFRAGHLLALDVDAPPWAWGRTELLVETVHGSGCEGDSGGPLFLTNSGGLGVLAIVSRSLLSYSERLCFHRIGLTVLAPYRAWIDETLAAYGSEPAAWWPVAPSPPRPPAPASERPRRLERRRAAVVRPCVGRGV